MIHNIQSIEVLEIDEYIIKKKYSLFPLIIVCDEFVWTGKWFSYVDVTLQKTKVRYYKFDEWNYTFYWTDWYLDYQFYKCN
jgi:hypothetical protein